MTEGPVDLGKLMTEQRCWIRFGYRVDLCMAELIGYAFGYSGEDWDKWEDWPCVLCGVPIKHGDWWWYLPDDLRPSRLRYGFEYGFCSECVGLFRIRPRDVPRRMWLEEMWERGAGERWPDTWPVVTVDHNHAPGEPLYIYREGWDETD